MIIYGAVIMKGIAYGVGVGPGDPELMTLKAVRLIRENDVIAVPGTAAKESIAYKIAVRNVPELAEKTLLPVNMPMTRDKAVLEIEHKNGAALIEEYLDKGLNVVYLTLGDPTVYCSFTYLQRILESDGYNVELVSGITSFCAAAARLNVPLAESDEEIHILPGIPEKSGFSGNSGTYVIMKSGRKMNAVKEALKNEASEIFAAENCTTDNEKLYRGSDEIPDSTGYFSLVIAKIRG